MKRLAIAFALAGALPLAAQAVEFNQVQTDKSAINFTFKQMAEVILKSPRSERAVFLGLGDLLHADNTENRTQRSGNILDVDTRYPKVLTASVLLMRQMVEMLLAHHERVEIRLLPGNHDEHSTIALRIGLAAFFDGHTRVTVDNDPSDYWFARFGVNLLFCDMVGFLDLYGLINARIVYLDRYGKTREIMSSLPDRVVKGLV